MKIAVMSDVHGNLEAFQSVIASFSNHGVEKVMFLGDIVGYGANPNECIELLTSICEDNIAGNHDYAAVGKTDITYFNPHARKAILWTSDVLSQANKRFLAALPLSATLPHGILVHSTPQHPELWDYIISVSEARIHFRNFTQHLCFVGHSHRPGIFMLDRSGAVSFADLASITLKEDSRYIINVGSVGQPRDGNPLASYGLYDTTTQQYRLIRVAYNIALAQQKILAAGLPPFLAERIAVGY
jgi:diadenosine tetraphosphatase ApaH/serine/threonine PP2A family protein phosphatase